MLIYFFISSIISIFITLLISFILTISVNNKISLDALGYDIGAHVNFIYYLLSVFLVESFIIVLTYIYTSIITKKISKENQLIY